MSYTKQNFLPGDELLASQLNAMDAQIAVNEQTGSDLKSAFVTSFSKNTTSIPDNTDYDDLTTPGNYYVVSAARARTMINSPSIMAHRLTVIELYAADRLIQVLQDMSNIYIRSKSTAWSTWKRVMMENVT